MRDEGIEPVDAARIALHARIVAMDRWCARHDSHGQTDVDAFFEAAARAPLAWTEGGRGFDPTAFGELVGFIAATPIDSRPDGMSRLVRRERRHGGWHRG